MVLETTEPNRKLTKKVSEGTGVFAPKMRNGQGEEGEEGVGAGGIGYAHAHLGKIGTASNNQVHIGELDLVDSTLLCWESADLVRRDNDILALLFLVRGCSASRSITGVKLGASAAFTDHASLGAILRTADIPDANSTIGTARDEDCRLNAPAKGPDTALSMTPHALQKPA